MMYLLRLVIGFAPIFMVQSSIFAKTDPTWGQRAKITPSDPTEIMAFAYFQAFSGDGNTAIITANGISGDNGVAYVFTRSGNAWNQEAKLVPSDLMSGDEFGSAVALSADGNTAMVSARNQQGGSVYVYTKLGGAWSQSAKLKAPDSDILNSFGVAVALSGDGYTAAITGAKYIGNNAPYSSKSPKVYIFARWANTWNHQSEISPAGNDIGSADSIAISTDGSTVVAGLQTLVAGAIHIYARSSNSWTEQFGTTLSSPYPVAISSDGNLAIASTWAKAVGPRVKVFSRTNDAWSFLAELSPTKEIDTFASSTLSADGNTILIGLPNLLDSCKSSSGFAYFYTRNGGTWAKVAEATPNDKSFGFGQSVALSKDGSTALIGGPGAGAAYIFTNQSDGPTKSAVNVTFTTSPPGLPLILGGVSTPTPLTVSQTPGSALSVEAPALQPGGVGSRYAFQRWSNCGLAAQFLTILDDGGVYTAQYGQQNLLLLSATPPAGGSVSASPGSVDGYYNSTDSVSVQAVSNPGYVFSGFSGDLDGNISPRLLSMSSPRSVTAKFQAPQPQPPPLRTISPDQGSNDTTVSATITLQTGSQFVPGATILLSRAGQTSISGTGVSLSSDLRTLTATFDLRKVAPGQWDVAVTSGGLTGRLTAAFTVNASASGGGVATCVCARTGAYRPPAPAVTGVESPAASPGGKYAVQASVDNLAGILTFQATSVATGAVLLQRAGPVTARWVFSPDDDRLLFHWTTGGVHNVEVHDLSVRPPRLLLQSAVSTTSAQARFSPTGAYLHYASVSAGGMVQTSIWRVKGVSTATLVHSDEYASRSISALATPLVRSRETAGLQPAATASPTLQISPAVLRFRAISGVDLASSDVVNVTASESLLSWTATSTQPWANVESISGTTPAVVRVTVAPRGLSPGLHTASIRFAAANATNSPQTLNIELQVDATGQLLQISPTALRFNVPSGDVTSTELISLTSSPGILSWTATSTQPWATVTTTSGITPDTVAVRVASRGLPAGKNTAEIRFAAANALNSPQTLNVEVNVAAPQGPLLQISPSVVRLNVTSGQVATTEAINVTASQGSLSWTATSSDPWASLTATSGATPGSLRVTVASAGLSVGTHTATVRFAAPSASNTPQTVNLEVTVAAAVPGTLLQLSPSVLRFNVPSGDVTSTELVGLTASQGVLSWTATSTESWASVTSTSGITPGSVAVRVSSNGLANGRHTAAIRFAAAAAANTPQTLNIELNIATPAPSDEFGAVTWGFGPDDSSFISAYATGGSAVVWTLVDLKNGKLLRSDTLLPISAAWWFSPCGDVVALAQQVSPAQVETALYRTSDGALISGSLQQFALSALASLSFSSTSASHTVAAGTAVTVLARNTACPSATAACATASQSVAVTRGSLRYNNTTQRYSQTVTLQNTGSAPVTGPVSLAFDSLPAGATVLANSGATSCASPAGSPYVDFVPSGNSLAVAQPLSKTVEFTAAGTGAGGVCACGSTGAYTKPNSGSAPAASSTKYSVSATLSGDFIDLLVRRTANGSIAFSEPVPKTARWGFSPDGDRFVVHYPFGPIGASVYQVFLYDLSQSPRRLLLNTSIATTSSTLVFSPTGHYFLQSSQIGGSLQLDMYRVMGVERAVSVHTNTIALPTSSGTTAAWGWSSDAAETGFVYSYGAGSSGTWWNLLSLTTGRLVTTELLPLGAAAWWFSPCADVLGIAYQASTAFTHLELRLMSSGTALKGVDVPGPVSGISLRSTATSQILTAGGQDTVLTANTACSTTPSTAPAGITYTFRVLVGPGSR